MDQIMLQFISLKERIDHLVAQLGELRLIWEQRFSAEASAMVAPLRNLAQVFQEDIGNRVEFLIYAMRERGKKKEFFTSFSNCYSLVVEILKLKPAPSYVGLSLQWTSVVNVARVLAQTLSFAADKAKSESRFAPYIWDP